jgi:hypothetical protein
LHAAAHLSANSLGSSFDDRDRHLNLASPAIAISILQGDFLKKLFDIDFEIVICVAHHGGNIGISTIRLTTSRPSASLKAHLAA